MMKRHRGAAMRPFFLKLNADVTSMKSAAETGFQDQERSPALGQQSGQALP
jgi:hypothetical protein